MKPNFNHITDINEREFVKGLFDMAERADRQNRPFFTDFYKIEFLKDVVTKYLRKDLSYTYFGGYSEAERQMLCISPYEGITESEFDLKLLRITVNTGPSVMPGHRDFLGSIMGLGINRQLFGDIIVTDYGADIIVQNQIAEYIMLELKSIGRYKKINTEVLDIADIVPPTINLKEIRGNVSSLRMDSVLSVMFGISRSEATKLINKGLATCNDRIVKASDEIEENNIIVLRGYGKARFIEASGRTKKDRINIVVQKYV